MIYMPVDSSLRLKILEERVAIQYNLAIFLARLRGVKRQNESKPLSEMTQRRKTLASGNQLDKIIRYREKTT